MIGTRPAVRRLLVVAVPVAIIATGLLLEARGTFAVFRFAVGRSSHDAPSARVVSDAERNRGGAVVSVFIRPRDLHGRLRGLLANSRRSGADWERPAWVSFFEDGRLVLSAPAGARIHGGSSRELKLPQGFRLYFRRKYGARELPGAVVFGDGHPHPLRRVVLHNDARHRGDGNRWQFMNPLAYDIARRVGSMAPPTRPVRFLLNGEFQGVYVLTEHLHPRDYFEAHPGRRMRESPDEINTLYRQVRALSPLDMRSVGRLVDLDSLTRWFIAVVFCATGDAYQEPGIFRDTSRESAQWFWVNWDMDGSFRHADLDSFPALLSRTGARRARRPNDPRPYILTTLLDRDAEYRAYFMRTWTDAMNHALTKEFLDERYAHYERLARDLGVDDRRFLVPLRHFLTERPRLVWQTAEAWLGTGPSVPVTVTNGDAAVRVDGRAVEAGWQGRYFPGTTLTLDVVPPAAPSFGHWLVNGRRVDTLPLPLLAQEPLQVEAVWK